MSPTVDALLPLSFLEAVRAVDRPDDDPDAEFVAELRNKRLGLSDTVYAQIRRYSDAARRRERQTAAEVAGIARLIGRRPDAEAVFRAAGRFLGERAYADLPGPTRRVVGSLPAFFARPLALGQLRRLARRYFGGTVRRDGAAVVLEVPAPLIGDAPCAAGCAYYESGFAELLGRLTGATADASPWSTCTARRRAAAPGTRASGAPSGTPDRRRLPSPGAPRPAPTDVPMLTPDTLPRFQAAIADSGADGWLLYDFRGTNPVAAGCSGSTAWSPDACSRGCRGRGRRRRSRTPSSRRRGRAGRRRGRASCTAAGWSSSGR
jgi:hypothetical protein